MRDTILSRIALGALILACLINLASFGIGIYNGDWWKTGISLLLAVGTFVVLHHYLSVKVSVSVSVEKDSD